MSWGFAALSAVITTSALQIWWEWRNRAAWRELEARIDAEITRLQNRGQ